LFFPPNLQIFQQVVLFESGPNEARWHRSEFSGISRTRARTSLTRRKITIWPFLSGKLVDISMWPFITRLPFLWGFKSMDLWKESSSSIKSTFSWLGQTVFIAFYLIMCFWATLNLFHPEWINKWKVGQKTLLTNNFYRVRAAQSSIEWSWQCGMQCGIPISAKWSSWFT
jgi:hypothetical protein